MQPTVCIGRDAFANGVDMDLKHFAPFNRAGDGFDGLLACINQLRIELDTATGNWAANAMAKEAAMQSSTTLWRVKISKVTAKLWP